MTKKVRKTEIVAPDAGYPSSIRLPAEMKAKLEISAIKRGRSLAAEMLARLANSLEDDERFGDLESQMFGRIVGSTIALEGKLIVERKRKAGEDIEHAEWWREAHDRADVRDKIIGAIEQQLGESARRLQLPTEIEARILKWLRATPDTQFKPDYREAVLQLIVAGLEADPARKQRWNS